MLAAALVVCPYFLGRTSESIEVLGLNYDVTSYMANKMAIMTGQKTVIKPLKNL